MLFKLLIKVLATVLVLAALAPVVSAAPASAPRPPSSSLPFPPVPARKPSTELPAAIQAANALRESLSASQRSALASIMDAHKASLVSVGAALGGSLPSRAKVNAASVAQTSAAQASVLASLESDMTKVLNATQKAQFAAGQRALPTPRATSAVVSRAAVSGSSSSGACSDEANDSYWGWEYSTWGYDWAYDNYEFSDGSDDAYWAYYDAWYAADYADYAYPIMSSNPRLAASYFESAYKWADSAYEYADYDYNYYGTYDGYYSDWDNYDASWYDYYAYQDLSACTYTVKPGDTLFNIAQQEYGDGNQWQAIYAANQAEIGADPTQLTIGLVLWIPVQQ